MKTQISNILFDKSMVIWCKQNADEETKKMKVKCLPRKFDNTVGLLKDDKIISIYEAYCECNCEVLPPIILKKYKNTQYFYVIDGRHRIVCALANGKNEIDYNLQEN